jgi:hypothetical protein
MRVSVQGERYPSHSSFTAAKPRRPRELYERLASAFVGPPPLIGERAGELNHRQHFFSATASAVTLCTDDRL